jgi:hypothetical protein
MSRTAIYVYCVVHCGSRPATARVPKGVRGATAPEVLEIGGSLWGVVAEVLLAKYGPEHLPVQLEDLSWVAETAVAHEAVVDYFARAKRATVVPMTMFTMFSSRERAGAELVRRARELGGIVKRIRGCDEWGVRITRAARPASARASTATRGGTAFLVARKRAHDEAQAQAARTMRAADRAFRVLSRAARSAVQRDAPERAATPPLLDAAFLVPSTRKARFRAAARRSAAACRTAGASLTLTGPWPAYSFVRGPRGLR